MRGFLVTLYQCVNVFVHTTCYYYFFSSGARARVLRTISIIAYIVQSMCKHMRQYNMYPFGPDECNTLWRRRIASCARDFAALRRRFGRRARHTEILTTDIKHEILFLRMQAGRRVHSLQTLATQCTCTLHPEKRAAYPYGCLPCVCDAYCVCV